MSFANRHVAELAVLAALLPSCRAEVAGDGVRPPECADDMWYPSNAAELGREVDRYIATADPPSLSAKPAGLICPHAGIKYSGPIAGAGYKTLKGHNYKRVVVLGFSHRHRFTGGAVLPKVGAYGTPLGNIPLDRKACDALLAQGNFAVHEKVHRREHSLEIQLPFLQRVLSGFKLVPVMVGDIEPDTYDRMAAAIAPLIGDDTLLVASSDFTHYGRRFAYVPFTDNVRQNLRKIDFSAAERIMALDDKGFLGKLRENGAGDPDHRRPQTVCGRGPITLMIKVLNLVGTYKGTRLAYDTSGRMTGDWSSTVSYMAIGFIKTGDKPKTRTGAAADEIEIGRLSKAERATILRIARDSATAALNGRKPINPRLAKYKLTDRLEAKGAAFVTLHNKGRLRGCIGHIIAKEPLVDSVVGNAGSAATKDYRFADNPVTAKEMNDIDVEVSVMSPLRRVKNPNEIVLGKHGVVLTRGMRRSVYLPQVATQTGWDIETFLSRLSRKANLPPDAWQRHATQLEVFTAEVFGEKESPHGTRAK